MKVKYDFRNKQFMLIAENEFEESWLQAYCEVDRGTFHVTKPFKAEGRWFQDTKDGKGKPDTGILFRTSNDHDLPMEVTD